jgi:spermidine synthase
MNIYFKDGKIIAQSGDVKVYEMDDVLYLDINHSLWMRTTEIKEIAEQIGDKVCGDCLEIGLGLGVASDYMLSHGAKSLTTIEINPDVIATYKQLNEVKPNHKIIQGSGRDFLVSTDERFDFVFLDFYSLIDEDTIGEIGDYTDLIISRQVLKSGGEIVAWFDPYTPDEIAETFKQFFIERGFILCKA